MKNPKVNTGAKETMMINNRCLDSILNKLFAISLSKVKKVRNSKTKTPILMMVYLVTSNISKKSKCISVSLTILLAKIKIH
jgi:hypothetical protein